MGRYRGPRIKIIRRLGNLPGLTTKVTSRKKTPGDHGKEQKKIKRNTLADDFKERLLEKQKLRYNYGISEKQLINYLNKAKRKEGSTEINLLDLLELRLDTIIFRLGFTLTVPAARQLVTHGHIIVNEEKVQAPSFECCINDNIRISNKKRSQRLVRKNLQITKPTPEHLLLNKNEITGKILQKPKRSNLDLEINELKVIEYYSR